MSASPNGIKVYTNMKNVNIKNNLSTKEKLKPLHQVHSYNDIRRLEPSLPELTIDEKRNFPPVTHPHQSSSR